MSDPTTPTGKRWVDADAPMPTDRILAIEQEAREPTDDGVWFTVDSLAAAMRLADMESTIATLDDDAAAIIAAAKEAEDPYAETRRVNRMFNPGVRVEPATKEAERE